MKRMLSLFVSVCLIIPLCSCQMNNKHNQNANGKINIITTIFPYYDFINNVAGDKANVTMLLKPGTEVHNYEPSPSDIIAIENCDLFVYNGGESDYWVDTILNSTENKINSMQMMDFVNLIYEESADHEHNHSHDHNHMHLDDDHDDVHIEDKKEIETETEDDKHSHKYYQGDEYDEHIWTSPKNAIEIVNAIKNKLNTIDALNKKYYENNTERYISELSDLDIQITQIINDSTRKEIVVGDRFPFLYFAKAYKLDYHCAFPGCSSETEPSVSVVTELIDVVRDEKIPVVFYIEFSSGAVAKILSEDTDAKTLMLHSCHNVTKSEFESKQTYLSLMKQNAVNLKEALK